MTTVTRPKVRTDPDEWIQQPDGHWECRHAPRTLGAVWDDITAALPAYGVDLAAFDYAGPLTVQDRDRLFPQSFRWIACFAVRGCSEGWYVHLGVVRHDWVLTREHPDATHEADLLTTLFLAKTFEGWETALALVSALTQLLDV